MPQQQKAQAHTLAITLTRYSYFLHRLVRVVGRLHVDVNRLAMIVHLGDMCVNVLS